MALPAPCVSKGCDEDERGGSEKHPRVWTRGVVVSVLPGGAVRQDPPAVTEENDPKLRGAVGVATNHACLWNT